MSARRPFDEMLNEWLDEGPDSAPREDLAAVLGGFPGIRQRARFGPWRLTMPTIGRLAVAAVAAIAVGALALSQIMSNSPSVGTQPTPKKDDFATETAGSFVRPFTYAIDPASGIELDPGSEPDAQRYTFRVTPAKAPDESGPLVIVQHPGQGIRLDPCAPEGSRVNLQPTPEDYIRVLEAVPALKVTPLEPRSIDGRPALGVDVQRQPDPTCEDAVVFARQDSFTCCWPDDPTWVRRTWALDVDGALVLITTPFGSATKDARLELANDFVETIHFEWPRDSASAAPG